jgi:hypothetical protein
VLVPTNKAVLALARKPYVGFSSGSVTRLGRPRSRLTNWPTIFYRHQGPPSKTKTEPGEIEMSEEEIVCQGPFAMERICLILLAQDKECNQHVRDWVSAHVVPVPYSSK